MWGRTLDGYRVIIIIIIIIIVSFSSSLLSHMLYVGQDTGWLQSQAASVGHSGTGKVPIYGELAVSLSVLCDFWITLSVV